MPRFIDWATDKFIKNAKETANTKRLVEILMTESDHQWAERVMPIMDNLFVSFTMQTGEPLCVNDMKKVAIDIYNGLKEKLVPEVPKPSTPSV